MTRLKPLVCPVKVVSLQRPVTIRSNLVVKLFRVKDNGGATGGVREGCCD